MSLDKIEAFADKLFEEKICKEYDRIIPVVADEAGGKSTFIMEFMTIWRQTTGREVDADDMIDQLVYSREGFQDALADYPPRSVIPVPDAARAIHRKEAMQKEQVEVEKDLLDVRVKEHVILLGYQDWDIIPDFLQRRRAKNAFYIPDRGRIWGYSRDGLDERYGADSWPDPQFRARFPSLEGTDLWRQYKREDRERKKERMRANSREGDESQSIQDIVDDIKSGGVEDVTGIHGGWNKPYIDPDLIEMKYEISRRDAKKIKKLLQSDSDIEVPEDGQTESPPQ